MSIEGSSHQKSASSIDERSAMKHKRSATISEFRVANSIESETEQQRQPEQEEEEDNDPDKPQVKLTKVETYKVTRSKSVHAFQEYGKAFVGSPVNNSIKSSSHYDLPISNMPPRSNLDSKLSTPMAPPPAVHPSPFFSNTIDDDNAQTSLSYSSNLLNYCQESPNVNYGLPQANNAEGGVRNATVIYRKKNGSESDYNLNEISPISNETSCTRVDKLLKALLQNITGNRSAATLKESGNQKLGGTAGSSTPVFPLYDEGRKTRASDGTRIKDDEDDDKDDEDDSFTSPVSAKFLPNLPSKVFWFIIFVLSTAIILMLGGFVPAVYILSKGTSSSVSKFFENLKNLPFLYNLSTKYLQVIPQPPKPNSIAGLADELKEDTEVVAMMNVVSNVLYHGIAYSPSNAMEPLCGFNKRDAMLDLAKLSTITTRLRNYGMQCDQSELILDAIEYMNLNMSLAMGVWIGSNDSVNKEQMDLMKRVVSKYDDPLRLINSIYIGNEVLFREDKTREELIAYIQDAKDFLKLSGIDDIPVGTSEIGSLIDPKLLDACDVVGANIHPFFAGVPVEYATAWTIEFLNLQVQAYNEKNTPIVLTEVGWPSGGGNFGQSVASLANLQYFVSDFLCTFRDLPIEYYYFEAFDEPWKSIFWEDNQQWETQWGIFNADRLSKFSLQNIGCL
ncbi:putative glucan endo-1,3-beta-glucosidase btgC [Candida viswanathii]|uniref:glucan endo-1,3-beta-D-glucosidase n=1 Tax=Candida viswanathii TaxID=5486 RepID=A0A367XZX4_9ASCO|nr:putative glucan endo-1,3-beta-glucosidase btgC [Candida viswanathii]